MAQATERNAPFSVSPLSCLCFRRSKKCRAYSQHNDPHNHQQVKTNSPPNHPHFNPQKRPQPHCHPTKRPTQTASKSFCRFRAAAVPRYRQTGSQGFSRSAHLYKLSLGSFVVRSATLKKPRNGGNFRDRLFYCFCVPGDAIRIGFWSGMRPVTAVC